eukprot:NODE_4694_length_649_cov_376.713805.p2 GENE.NODE_4694_length_649_cov_376.713805~~NODE_4694_length_649_cov_376.713805.p2  ORF type:complete len:104 (-),score=8.43 NODE_4694_length_649_cov_376.713805:86-397(-)
MLGATSDGIIIGLSMARRTTLGSTGTRTTCRFGKVIQGGCRGLDHAWWGCCNAVSAVRPGFGHNTQPSGLRTLGRCCNVASGAQQGLALVPNHTSSLCHNASH